MVMPFDVSVDTALRKISAARGRGAVDIAEAQGVGTVYGYYLAGAVAPLVYRAARDRLQAAAATQRAHESLRADLEHPERTGHNHAHLELVK